ncbi:MAG: hypothetical protein CVV64_09750 [Candidatus Wallbacteria bacterium HGW-Wallbacteria-1]|jgi:hypothetical protein|uniref:Uncharacterized protein n=1 Tax=Candidatus Wallbacteria bacterium HGW-Wallbacteria-1 TaxID=2013854 RepID=A0A2N1PQL4_9BACT|nr:MAG: hypothetical protein CVV64_09750 [Candidatus Wallbacteria bacterium HGW-Wallbacteria-1]
MNNNLSGNYSLLRVVLLLSLVLSLGSALPQLMNPAFSQSYSGKVNDGVYSLNVREGPSVRNSIVTEIHSGQRFTVIDEQDGWYSIMLPDGTKGWTSGKYVSVTKTDISLKLLSPPDGGSVPDETVTLSWQSSEDSGCYRVVVKESATGSGDRHFLPQVTTQVVKGLKKGCTYAWMVASMTESGLSDYTQAWTFTVGAEVVSECPAIQEAHVISGIKGSASELIPGYQPKVVGSDSKVVLYSVVGARTADGKYLYFLGDTSRESKNYPSAAVIFDRASNSEKKITLNRWDSKKWGALKFQWGRIDARLKHSNLSHYNGEDSPDYVWYTNVVPNGSKEGQWWKWDRLEYAEKPLKNSEDRWWHFILPFLKKDQPWKMDAPALSNGGTLRFKVQVIHDSKGQNMTVESYGKFTQPFSSGGTLVDEDYYCGIREEVQRVTYLGGTENKFLNGMFAYQGVPWLYGSAVVGKSHGHQTEKFAGFDCADLAMGAYRLAVDPGFKVKLGAHTLAQSKTRQKKYPWLDFAKSGSADNRGGKFRLESAVTPAGEAVVIGIGSGEEEIAPGDLVFFDWNKDGKWDHTTVFVKDGPRKPGVLSGDDILTWANHSGVAIQELNVLLHTDRTRMGIRYWPSK